MGKVNFSDDFKRDAVHQLVERGYPVAEVSQRLGVSPHSLHAWKKRFSQPPGTPSNNPGKSSSRVVQIRGARQSGGHHHVREKLRLIRKDQHGIRIFILSSGYLTEQSRLGRFAPGEALINRHQNKLAAIIVVN